MTITLTNPRALPKVDFHRQVSIATGSKLVFMAGQVAWDADGALVGEGDLAAQVEQCFLNVGAALAEIGGSFYYIAKLTIYVADWDSGQDALSAGGPCPSLRETRCHDARPPGHFDWCRRVVPA